MQWLAQGTGGRAFYNTNDIQNAIRHAVDESEVTYMLAFYPDPAKLDSKFHEIKVDVKRKGLDVRHRKGYLAEPKGAQGEDDRAERLKSAIWSPLEGTGITLKARLLPSDALAPGTARLNVTIDAADLAFQQQNDRWTDTIDMVFAGKASNGTEINVISEQAQMALKEESYEKLRREGLSFTKDLPVSAQTIQIRVVIYDRSSGRLGSVTVPIKGTKQGFRP